MQFNGRVYYDFDTKDVWRFLQLLLGAQREGAQPGLEWKPYLTDGVPDDDLVGQARLLAAAEIVRTEAVLAHGAFLSAVLTAVHGEAMEVHDPAVLEVALRVAGLDAAFIDDDLIDGRGAVLLGKAQAEAEAVGVDAVPSVYRHGPVVAIRTTAAVTMGSSLRRLELIDAMLQDDGLWELRKP
jgi:hypothetical protein